MWKLLNVERAPSGSRFLAVELSKQHRQPRGRRNSHDSTARTRFNTGSLLFHENLPLDIETHLKF